MFKRFYIFSILFFICIIANCPYVNAATSHNLEASNAYFSFAMPNETKGMYSAIEYNNGIYIYEKISEELGFGGFAFGLKIFKNPKDYSDTPKYRKLGELTDKKDVLYDMVLMRPTEIQYGGGDKAKKNYNYLYDVANKIEIKGINGNKYIKDKGMKGEELYYDVLKKYKQDEANKKLLNKVGYAYYDINSDGIEELFIGNKSNIYDVFTMVDRHPAYVVGKGDADKFYVCGGAYLCTKYSFDKKEITFATYIIEKNSKEMSPQIALIYDANKNKKQPWFIVYGKMEKPEKISKKQFKERKKIYKKRKSFDFVPLDKFE